MQQDIPQTPPVGNGRLALGLLMGLALGIMVGVFVPQLWQTDGGSGNGIDIEDK